MTISEIGNNVTTYSPNATTTVSYEEYNTTSTDTSFIVELINTTSTSYTYEEPIIVHNITCATNATMINGTLQNITICSNTSTAQERNVEADNEDDEWVFQPEPTEAAKLVDQLTCASAASCKACTQPLDGGNTANGYHYTTSNVFWAFKQKYYHTIYNNTINETVGIGMYIMFKFIVGKFIF